MEVTGSILLILALGLFTAVFVARPFLSRNRATSPAARQAQQQAHELEHQHSSLLAERDRTLNALQELDFDFALGKVPEEEYPAMRAELLTKGAAVLRALDAFEANELGLTRASAEDRMEAAVAARRADAVSRQSRRDRVREEVVLETAGGQAGAASTSRKPDPVEDMIASRKRSREESAAGFCPGCGKPVQKSDKFCSKCGRTL